MLRTCDDVDNEDMGNEDYFCGKVKPPNRKLCEKTTKMGNDLKVLHRQKEKKDNYVARV